MTGRRNSSAGVTVVELMVVMVIVSIVLTALGFFMARIVRLPPTYIEQGSITADGRVEMERMSDIIRNARDVGPELWLQQAEACLIEVNSNADADDTSELVRYRLVGSELRRQIDGGAEVVLARSLRNDCGDSTKSLFNYYSLGGDRALEVDPLLSGLPVIDRIIIRLIIDVDPNQLPEAAEFESIVTPRRGET